MLSFSTTILPNVKKKKRREKRCARASFLEKKIGMGESVCVATKLKYRSAPGLLVRRMRPFPQPHQEE